MKRRNFLTSVIAAPFIAKTNEIEAPKTVKSAMTSRTKLFQPADPHEVHDVVWTLGDSICPYSTGNAVDHNFNVKSLRQWDDCKLS